MKSKNKIFVIIAIIGVIIGNLIIFNFFFGNMDIDDTNEGKIFTDSLGRKIKVPEHPEQIVSMAPAITETLYALEIDDRLVGVTDYCNYPEDAKTKTNIGGYSTPNLEIIVSLEPDLVISARNDPEIIGALENYDITIIVILSYTLDEIIDNIKNIGWLVDVEDKATKITDSMKNKINSITDKTTNINKDNKLKCYFEVWETPQVAGGGSFLNDMIDKAGGVNTFGDLEDEWPIVSHESVIANNPDVIFITEHSAPWYSQNVCEREGYNLVKACINNRIYKCFDDIYLRDGPRIIMALENMTLYLYPNLFG